MLVANRCQPLEATVPGRLLEPSVTATQPTQPRGPIGDHSQINIGWSGETTLPIAPQTVSETVAAPPTHAQKPLQPQEIDPLYLFACHLQWEKQEDLSAAWDLLAAARSTHPDTRAHARALLASSHQLGNLGAATNCGRPKQPAAPETDMIAPYGLDIVDNCASCSVLKQGGFCDFAPSTREALNQVGHRSILPAGAILFVEGQTPRGMFIICSGKVNLSTTSREGKTLILKTADAGEALGISAAISGMGYESTAETATPCQLTFVDRKQFLELMQNHSQVGLHTAQCLSRDFQSAYRDIHDLVLTRSSSGKLARLLLSHVPVSDDSGEPRIHCTMTHEEMAQRIGASRETVTRLLSDLRKKQLIRLDGPTLVIRDRSALEAMTV